MRRPTLNLLGGAVILTASLLAGNAHAASCCGGGGSATLTLPKFSASMVGLSVDTETYHGFWDQQGKRRDDPPGSTLVQYRINAGYARRLTDHWQASVNLPYVLNDNRYSGVSSHTQGLGDTTVGIWREFFDNIMCVTSVETLEDLLPALYVGGALTIPTGISPYDDVTNSFDVTGRGFYRLDLNLLVEKTVYPWTVTLSGGYGVHFERPVNREYGVYVTPYTKKLGDRYNVAFGGGYTWFLGNGDMVTATGTLSDVREFAGTIDGRNDPTSGLSSRRWSLALGWNTPDRAWVAGASFSRSFRTDGWGANFPMTDIVSLRISHVLD
ncbi:MAG: hypothetical protein HQK87_02195 [Nitrospinae bacterium]|nr:hypothetical protein [Nitrospinota bacterium]